MASDRLRMILSEVEEAGFEETTYFTGEDYADAIIGISTDGNLIYDYDKMIEHVVNEHGMTSDQAVEYIEGEVVYMLPYMGDGHPIIMNHFLYVEEA